MKQILVYVRHLTMTSILTYNFLQGQCCPVEFSVMMEMFSICAAWRGSCGLHVAHCMHAPSGAQRACFRRICLKPEEIWGRSRQ